MAHPKAAWGMEIGADAIKAIRLERDGDKVTVSDFAVIPHKKVLTTPDMDRDEMVRIGLGQFISQKVLEGQTLVMSVPGHAAFARFAKLPPVEPKKVPDIVRFEAVQQIPFPIDQVEWDYETFITEGSPEIEVGIFAITRERVQQRLGLYAELGIVPESLTLSPVAVYNAMAYEHDLARNKKAIIYIDIGTSATDLIVADQNRCWIRTFPLGGTHFTEAIATAFKLSYTKAEKLKHEAATSKYAKQIMQAMRPVFSDLLQDVQRSIGYYQSLHREADLTTVVGLGSTFKIPGLRKFLGQQLQVNVARLDEYKKIAVTGREAASFAENAVNMATAYGLALQGVGLAAIDVNLMPVGSLRDQMWQAKTKWFAAAAAIIVAGAAMMLYRPLTDRGAMFVGEGHPKVDDAIRTGERLIADFKKAAEESQVGAMGLNFRRLVDDREVWPHLVNDAAAALNSAGPQPVLLGIDIQAIQNVDPAERRFIQLMSLGGDYRPAGEGSSRKRLIQITMNVELSHADPIAFLNDTVARWLRDHANVVRTGVPYRILDPKDVPTWQISLNREQLQTFLVDDAGQIKTTGPGGGKQPVEPVAPAPPQRARPPATGGGSGDGAAGGPATGAGGSGMPGKNKGTGRYTPPSVTGGAGSSSGGSQAPGQTPSQVPGDGGPVFISGGTGRTPTEINLETLAPIPAAPAAYLRNAKFYRLPITFWVELIEPEKAPQADRAATTPGQAPSPASAGNDEETSS